MDEKKNDSTSQTSGVPANPKDGEDVAALKQTIEKLESQADEYLNGWKRAQADYQNLQKETAKAREDFSQFANESLLRECITLVDYFDYAFRNLPDTAEKSEWLTGIQHIYKELMQILERHGVTIMQTVGQQFDPQRHEAMEEVQSNGKSGTVVEELQKGFLLNNKILRPARVKIAK